MENSEAYSIVKALMEKDLLVIQHQELVEWLGRLEARRQITEEEMESLLQLARELKICNIPIGDQVATAFN